MEVNPCMFSDIIHVVALRTVILEVNNLMPTVTKALTYLYPKECRLPHCKEERGKCMWCYQIVSGLYAR
jgi:hypothetical protein